MSESSSPLKPSPLASEHERLGAKTAPFAGWEMPIQYNGIVAEHDAVRESAGIFDISHMGQLWIHGPGAADWLNRMLTNDIADLEISEGQYTLMLNDQAGVIDDLIIYRATEDRFFLVVNASKIEEDLAWLNRHGTGDVTIEDHSPDYGAVAVQGPDSEKLWAKVAADLGELPPRNGIMRFETGEENEAILVCRTGYTGEDGFELFASADSIGRWFKNLIEAGATPCGLGARDTLRLEKCYPLNGNDLDAEHTPLEAGLGFFVKLTKQGSFTGQPLLDQQKAEGLKRRLAAIRQTEKGPPPRAGYAIFEKEGETEVTKLTSGSLSPTLGCGIGLAYLPIELAKTGTALEIEVRGRRFGAEVVKKPFV